MNKTIRKLLIFYILLQPFMEIIFFYRPPLSDLTALTIPTLVRILLVGLIAVLFLWTSRQKKYLKFVLLYGVAVAAYLVVHILLTRHNPAYANDGFQYSLLQEGSYLIRLTIPVIILIISATTEINRALFEKIVLGVNLIFSGIIVLTNLFKVAVANYNKTSVISGNIFDWFSIPPKYSFMYLASDGFFNFANTVSGILFFLMPLAWYFFLKKPSWLSGVTIVLNLLSGLMIGTRVALLGFAVSWVFAIFSYLLDYLVHQNQGLKSYMLVMLATIGIVFAGVYPYTPAVNRKGANDMVTKNISTSIKTANLEHHLVEKYIKTGQAEQKQMTRAYIDQKLDVIGVYGNVVSHSNPYLQYADMWMQVMNWPAADRINYRRIEKQNIQLLASQFPSWKRQLVGISYNRMNYFIFNYERDILAQYYTIGILGLLFFIAPFFIVVLMLIWWLFKRREFLDVESLTYLAAAAFLLFAGVYTGNVVDSPTAMSIFAFVIGQRYLFKKREGTER